MSFRKLVLLSLSSVCVLVAPAALAQEAESNVSLPRYPSISPNGETVVFSYHGDLWRVDVAGGSANRLSAHPAEDTLSRFSPDGTKIAFTSDRRGLSGLYTMNADGTGVSEVLVVDRASLITDFADDGSLYFTGYLEPDVYRAPRPYKVDADGGVHERVHDAFGRSPTKERDGDRILFVRGDSGWDRRHARGPDTRDVWLHDGEAFTQLTQWRGNDGRPRWIGDGRFIYTSDRNDRTVNLYLADADDGEEAERNARRLTRFTDRDVEDFDVTPDGETLVFASWDALYTLDLTQENAQPQRLTIRAAEDEGDKIKYVTTDSRASDAALSPDGKTMAIVAYGQVYVRGTDERAPTRRVTRTQAAYGDVAWSPDGGTLYFVGDESGRDAIYAAIVALTRTQVREELQKLDRESPATQPTTRPATHPTTQSAEIPHAPNPDRWPDAVAFHVELVSESESGDSDPVPSPDGTKLAFTRGVGDVVILDLESGDETLLLDGWAGADYLWSPDSKHILYVTDDADFNADVWVTRADGTGYRGKGKPVNLTRHPDNDGSISLSADGRVLALGSERINEEYDVFQVYLDEEIETLTPQERAQYHTDLAEQVKKRKPIDVPEFAKQRGSVSPLVKSPTTQPTTEPATRPTTGPTTRATTRSGVDELREATAAVGRELGKALRGAIRGEDNPATQPTADASAEDDAASKRKGQTVADLDELPLERVYLRLERVSREPGNEGNVTLLPDASAVYYTSDGELKSRSWEGDTSSVGSSVNVVGTNLTGSSLVFLHNGRGGTQATNNNARETFAADDRLEINLAKENEQKFRSLARTLGMRFYHSTMKGLDWNQLIADYAPLARATRTPDEFGHVANRLLGELNASHLGVSPPGEDRPARQSFGRLGVRTVPHPEGFEVVEVLETGPAGRGVMKLEVGDVITQLELEPVDRNRPLEVQLADKVNREVVVTAQRGDAEIHLLLTPVSYGRISSETYDSWRLANLRRVEEMSDGRLGYIHIRGMDQGSLDTFERDLYAACEGKDGLIIDVRNNGGGWTTDRLLASIMYPRHAYTIPRGMRESDEAHRANLERGGYPQDRLFIQRYSLPTNMLANENSFSNAEIIAHAFKTLGRGTLVGQETAGGVISTGSFTLVDGTRVRLPFRGWYLMNGEDMENNGAVPDLLVPQTPESEVAGEDPQLEAAVQDLLERLPEAADAQ